MQTRPLQLALVVGVLVHTACSALLRARTGFDSNNASANSSARSTQAPSLVTWYGAHSEGRGIWKWGNSLEAYDQHLASFVGQQVALMEVGVQSGGSALMWQEFLGAGCHYYGVDIDGRCTQFTNDHTTIYIGDQGKVETWNHFFANVVPALNVAVDDGGHLPVQMLVTLQQVWPRLAAGGFIAIEDIHGQNDNYIPGFFDPAADFLAAQGAQVASVHIYPFMLVVRKAGGAAPTLPAPAVTVSEMPALTAALPQHRGAAVGLANPNWGSFLSAQSLKAFFQSFYDMHGGSVQQVPAGCFALCKELPCTLQTTNSEQQNLISAVHILPTQATVVVPPAPPVISAVRKGKVWLENVCEKAPQHGQDYNGYR